MEKLQAIRAKCVEANPSLEYDCPQCGGNGWEVGSDHGCNGSEQDCYSSCPVPVQVACSSCGGAAVFPTREVRLADVLLAIEAAPGATGYAVAQGGAFLHNANMPVPYAYWRFREDDLEKQSPETLEFIGKVLGV